MPVSDVDNTHEINVKITLKRIYAYPYNIRGKVSVSVSVSVQTRKLQSVSYPYPSKLRISAKYLSADTYPRISAAQYYYTKRCMKIIVQTDPLVFITVSMSIPYRFQWQFTCPRQPCRFLQVPIFLFLFDFNFQVVICDKGRMQAFSISLEKKVIRYNY